MPGKRDFMGERLFEVHGEAKRVVARLEDARVALASGRRAEAAEHVRACIYPASYIDVTLADLAELIEKGA